MRNEPDLSFIKADINLSEVAPLQRLRVLAFVNCYLQRMTHILNEFAVRAERALIEAERHLDRTDLKLTLLEAKLAQIPDIDTLPEVSTIVPSSITTVPSTTATVSATSPTVTLPPTEQEGSPPSTVVVQAERVVVTQTTVAHDTVIVTEPPSSSNVLRNKDDPMYAKYFKMLKMGVVEQAVKLKMQAEGVDPSVLDVPDGVSLNALSSSLSPSATSSSHVVSPIPEEAESELQMKGAESSSDDDSVASFSDSE